MVDRQKCFVSNRNYCWIFYHWKFAFIYLFIYACNIPEKKRFQFDPLYANAFVEEVAKSISSGTNNKWWRYYQSFKHFSWISPIIIDALSSWKNLTPWASVLGRDSNLSYQKTKKEINCRLISLQNLIYNIHATKSILLKSSIQKSIHLTNRHQSGSSNPR